MLSTTSTPAVSAKLASSARLARASAALPFFAESVLQELAHLAPALADQAGHEHVRVGLPRDLPEQRALAHAAAGEEAHTLPFTERQQRVHRAHARGQGPRDARARERVR